MRESFYILLAQKEEGGTKVQGKADNIKMF